MNGIPNGKLADGLVEMLARVQAIYDHLEKRIDIAELRPGITIPDPGMEACARLIFERLEAIEDALDAEAPEPQKTCPGCFYEGPRHHINCPVAYPIPKEGR